MWRGLSLTNKPVAQPDLYVTFPAGQASITLGGWANIDLGKYDDPNNDISESGGAIGVQFRGVRSVGGDQLHRRTKTTLTGGVTAYIYPNEDTALALCPQQRCQHGRDLRKVGFDAPLSPKIAGWYDVDKIKGAYSEGSISHTIPAMRRCPWCSARSPGSTRAKARLTPPRG